MAAGRKAGFHHKEHTWQSGSKNGKLEPQAPAAQPSTQPPTCPLCNSNRVWKDGLRATRYGDVQRYICRQCGKRFSETPKPLQTAPYGSLNRTSAIPLNRQVCVTGTQGAKNLAEVETRQKRAAGATKPDQATVKGKIIEYMWWMKKQGYAESTITTYAHLLKVLTKRGANLYDPESVKETIAMQETWSGGRKSNAVKAYALFLKMQGQTWEKPKYKAVEKLPFIPTENEIDELIAGCNKQIATFLRVLKETAARRGEAYNLKWTDIDLVTNTVRITPEKGSNPRIFRISTKLAAMLGSLPKTSQRVWVYKNTFYLDRGFRRQRKRIVHKLGNPRLLQIHFHTLRHWKATIEYAKTKDILYVMQLLGHKNIKNTLKYTQLVNLPQDEKFICKVAKNLKEASQLIEAGFEYVTEIDGCKLFKKRKTSYLGSGSIPAGPWSSLV